MIDNNTIYKTVSKEITKGVTDWREITQNVADSLKMDKTAENYMLIQEQITLYNVLHNTEY